MRIFIPIVFALYAIAAAAQIYSWKDAEGRTHYSDRPPDGKTPSLKVLPNTVDNTIPKPAPAVRAQPGEPAPAKAPGASGAPSDQQVACDKAKADLQALLDRPRRTAVSKGGKFFALDSEERSEEEAKLRTAIEENCR